MGWRMLLETKEKGSDAKVKRILGLVALGLLLAVPVFAQTVSVGEYTANPGDVVNVEVKVDDQVKNVAGAQVLLDFSTVTPAGGPALSVTSEADVKYGVIPAGGFIAVNLGVPGQANIGVVATSGGNGPGTLLTIPLKVPANAVPGAVYALNLVTADLNDPAGNIIATKAVGGKITIAGAAPPPPPPAAGADIQVGSYEANAGDVVNVEVKVSDKVKNVAGAQVLLKFGDIGAVTSEADVKYGVIPAGGFIAVNLGVAGEANIGVVATSGGNGPGTLLTIPIKLKADLAAGEYALTLVTADLNDPAGNVLTGLTLGNGKITVKGVVPPPPPPPPAAGADIQVGSYEANAGDVVNVEVKVSDKVKNVAGAQVLLKFGDIGAVTSEADVKYGVIPAGGFIAVNLGVAGEANIGVVATSGGNGPGTLLTIPIKLKADLAAGEYALTLVTADLNDPAGNVLTGLTLGNGKITVKGVVPPPPAAVAKVEVTPATVTLKVGETATLTAKALDAQGNEIAGKTFTWESSAPAVATVDASGKVTAVAKGTASITATADGVKSAPVTVTVEEVAPPPPPVGAALTVATDPATPVKPGDVVNILINVNEAAKNVAGAQVVVNFGALGAVTAEADVKYGVIPAGGFIAVNLGTPGEANIGVVATSGGNGPGTLLTIPIKVAADAKPGEYPINITLASLNDPTGTDIPVTVTGGKVVVAEVAPPPAVVPGDLTGDGKLTVDDVQAAILLAFQAQPDPAKVKIVDVNNDGKLSLADLRIMLRRALGLPDVGA
jgi:hypothetical protein